MAKPRGILHFLDKNVGMSGFFMPALLLAAGFDLMQFVLLLYSGYFFAVLLYVYVNLIRRVEGKPLGISKDPDVETGRQQGNANLPD